MKKISSHALEQLCQNTTELQPDKVYLTKDNTIVKIIYDRHLISSSTIYPYAKRIKNNSQQLLAKGISTVDVKEIFYCPEKKLSVVIYPALTGTDCRKQINENSVNVLEKLAEYTGFLHSAGVFFWDLHLGNILYQENENFSLIDIASVNVKSKSLGPIKRARNISHLVGYKYDNDAFKKFGITKFINTYLSHANMNQFSKKLFLYYLQKRLIKKSIILNNQF